MSTDATPNLRQETLAELRERIERQLMRTDEVGMHAVGRALVQLQKRQTAIEKKLGEAIISNNQGFVPYETIIGGRDAEFYEAKGYLETARVRHWQRVKNPKAKGAKPRILKYAGQLAEIAKEAGHLRMLPPKPRKRKPTAPQGELLV